MNKELRKYAIVILIIVFLGFGVYLFTDYLEEVELPSIFQPRVEEVDEETDIDLAENWQKEEAPEGAIVKLSKDTEREISLNIILNKEEEIEYEDPQTYTDRLIAGTRSSLPTLVYIDDQTDQVNDYFVRYLEGYYWQAGLQIGLSQRIYLEEDVVYVITASYDNRDRQELEEEINQNFDQLTEEYIRL